MLDTPFALFYFYALIHTVYESRWRLVNSIYKGIYWEGLTLCTNTKENNATHFPGLSYRSNSVTEKGGHLPACYIYTLVFLCAKAIESQFIAVCNYNNVVTSLYFYYEHVDIVVFVLCCQKLLKELDVHGKIDQNLLTIEISIAILFLFIP